MELILIRHGKTIENEMGIFQGHTDGELSEKGKAQARQIGFDLKSKKFSAIYSSDLGRALDTAAHITAQHPQVPFFEDDRLRERCYGVYDGITSIDDLFSAYEDKTPHSKPLQGESIAEFRARLNDFYQMLEHTYSQSDAIVIVTHYGPIINLISLLNGDPIEHIIKNQEEKIKNCQIIKVLV